MQRHIVAFLARVELMLPAWTCRKLYRGNTFTGSAGLLGVAEGAAELPLWQSERGSSLTPASIESSCCVSGPAAGCRPPK